MHDCDMHCTPNSCGWTDDWACPWEESQGLNGWANDDGTIGFHCCCIARTSAREACGGSEIAGITSFGEAFKFLF